MLKDAGLVREEKRGRENLYALEAAELIAVNRWLTGFWSSRLGAQRTRATAVPARPQPMGDLFAFDG